MKLYLPSMIITSIGQVGGCECHGLDKHVISYTVLFEKYQTCKKCSHINIWCELFLRNIDILNDIDQIIKSGTVLQLVISDAVLSEKKRYSYICPSFYVLKFFMENKSLFAFCMVYQCWSDAVESDWPSRKMKAWLSYIINIMAGDVLVMQVTRSSAVMVSTNWHRIHCFITVTSHEHHSLKSLATILFVQQFSLTTKKA